MHILINRTDNIGDVILTLPLAAKLKEHFPTSRISMLARTYAKDIVEACPDIDAFVEFDSFWALDDAQAISFLKHLEIDVFLPVYANERLVKLMKKAEVPLRIGHYYRTYFFWHTNKLIHIKRKRCGMHQAQMCLQYLKAFNLPFKVDREQLAELIHFQPKLIPEVKSYLNPQAFNLVLHPGTNGNTLEWPMTHFLQLVDLLPTSCQIFVTGSEKEKERFAPLRAHPRVVDLCGQLSLPEFISFLKAADGVVVGSTGPLHLSAALGTRVLGLFPPQEDLDIVRWGPLGQNTWTLEAPHCALSLKRKRCGCMQFISPQQVLDLIMQQWLAPAS